MSLRDLKQKKQMLEEQLALTQSIEEQIKNIDQSISEIESIDPTHLKEVGLHLYKVRDIIAKCKGSQYSEFESLLNALGFEMMDPSTDPDFWYSSTVSCREAEDLTISFPEVFDVINSYKGSK